MYKPGETVVITLKNNGKSTLEFSDSTLGDNTKYQNSPKDWNIWVTGNV